MKKVKKFFLDFNKISLRSKFIAIVIMAIFIPMLIVLIIMSGYVKQIMIKQVVVAVESTVNQISNSLDEMIKGQIYSISGVVMNNGKIYSLLTEEYKEKPVQKYLDTLEMSNIINSGYEKMYQDIKLAAIIGKNDVLYNLEMPTYDSGEVYSRVLEIKNSTKDIGITINWNGLIDNIFTSHKTENIRSNKVIIVTMNIFMPKTGEYVGMQVYAIPESVIYEKYYNTDVAQSGKVVILNHKDLLISSSEEQDILEPEKFNLKYQEYISGSLGSLFKDNNLIISENSPLNLWQTLGVVPKSYVTSKVNNAFNLFWFVIFWFVLVCLGIFILLSEKIIRPIKRIINSMEKFEKGEMKSYVEVSADSELGLLESYYNRMINKINHHIVYEYELDKQKKQLEYDVLISQINSHFLSNTLESIVWEARAADAVNVAKMASSLGRFFRLSSKKGNLFVLVEEEIEHINAYVGIQKMRYGNKFDFALNIDDESLKRLKTLKILLQPLVENAIMHSLDGAVHIVTIEVKIYIENAMLIFEVSDNGTGISEENLKRIKENMKTNNNKNIGLRNVKERIKLYFENVYSNADLIIESKYNCGTTVKLIVPVLK